MSKHQQNGDFPGIDASRRSFITKFAAAVFAAPVITSFALDGMAQATTVQRGDEARRPRHHLGNQAICNQYVHNQTLFNQCIANQHLQNQTIHKLCLPNQTEGIPWLPWDQDSGWWGLGECLPFDNHRRRRGLWFL